MKRTIGVAGLAAVLSLIGGGDPVAAARTLISISCGAPGRDADACRLGAQTWASATGNQVRLVTPPGETGDRLAQLTQWLSGRTEILDVVQIDLAWPAMLADQLIDLSPYIDQAELAHHFPTLVANDTVKGRLVALPWYAEIGLLFFRRDLLEKHRRGVPQTWAELTRTAAAIQAAERGGAERLWGYLWPGRASESLTCNALEWIDSFGGGTIVDADGKVTINNPKAIEALELAASWVGTISPLAVLGYGETEVRTAFQLGNAVFMRHWSQAWSQVDASDSPVRGKVGVAALPRGDASGRAAGILGGGQLAVTRLSRHPAVAADLVRTLAGTAEQKRRAVSLGLNPTLPALYQDPDLQRANPLFEQLFRVLTGAAARPVQATGGRYAQVSADFSNAVVSALSGRLKAGDALARLQYSLERLNRSRR